MTDFEPPVKNYEITAFHANEAGGIDRATLRVVDNFDDEFTLTVEAHNEHDRRTAEELGEGGLVDDSLEPIFIIPGAEIDPQDLDTILGSSPELLAKYLVAQEFEG